MSEVDAHAPRTTRRFQDGGALRRGSFYVERRADREIIEALAAGEFCYVLAPRQIGKSSLRVRAEERLRERGIRCASVDLTRIGAAGVTADEWYFGLVEELALSLWPERDPADFWARRADLSPVHRFMRFLLDEVLRKVDERVVISIDEIDMVLGLPFPRDDFFAAIRAVYNARADDPIYERLTFCLFGVATPGELMEDPSHTPFNIGRAIRLDDFTTREARALLPGLAAEGSDAETLLEATLDWTSGHPYMTQRVLSMLAAEVPTHAPTKDARERVDTLVRRLFLERGRLEDPNLAYAELRLQKAQPAELKMDMLRIYRRLLYGAQLAVRGDDPAQQELRLAGMVSERASEGGAQLVIRNRIFATVFDLRWVDENTVGSPLVEPVAQWLRFKKQDDFLLHGAALEVALDWTRGRVDLSAEEREFVDACVLADGQRKAAERAARERRIFAALMATIALALFTGVGLMRERTYRRQAERHQIEAEDRLKMARARLERVKAEAEQKVAEAEKQSQAWQQMAKRLEREALERRDSTRQEAEQEAAFLRQKASEAERNADEGRKAADAAKKIANEAADALKRSEEATLGVQKALETERVGRELAEKQLQEEREYRARLEARLQQAQQEIVRLAKETCWPNEAPPPIRTRQQIFDRPLNPLGDRRPIR